MEQKNRIASLQLARAGQQKAAPGFTLIELLVVILIIGILIAVAAPSFLGQQDKAKDSEAQQSLAVAYRVAKAEAVDNSGNFTQPSFTPGDLANAIEQSEPQLGEVGLYDAASQVPAGQLGVITSGTSSDNLSLGYKSKSGKVCSLIVTVNSAPQTNCVPAEVAEEEDEGEPVAFTATGIEIAHSGLPTGFGIPTRGDTVTYTFSEPPAPGSVLPGWDGSEQRVSAQLVATGDNNILRIYNESGDSVLPLGEINLGRNNYLIKLPPMTQTPADAGKKVAITTTEAVPPGEIPFPPYTTPGSPAVETSMTASGNTITVEFGGTFTYDAGNGMNNNTAPADLVWSPMPGLITNDEGYGISVDPASESGPHDIDF